MALGVKDGEAWEAYHDTADEADEEDKASKIEAWLFYHLVFRTTFSIRLDATHSHLRLHDKWSLISQLFHSTGSYALPSAANVLEFYLVLPVGR